MSFELSELTVRVYYEDIDFSGHVYHASYLRFLERGRTEWLIGRGFSHQDLAANSGIVFAVRSMQIDFLAPALVAATVLVAAIRDGRSARLPASLREALADGPCSRAP